MVTENRNEDLLRIRCADCLPSGEDNAITRCATKENTRRYDRQLRATSTTETEGMEEISGPRLDADMCFYNFFTVVTRYDVNAGVAGITHSRGIRRLDVICVIFLSLNMPLVIRALKGMGLPTPYHLFLSSR